MAAAPGEKAFCVLELAKINSVTVVQSGILEHDMVNPHPQGNPSTNWSQKFRETGCLCKRKSSRRPTVSEEQVYRVHETFRRSVED